LCFSNKGRMYWLKVYQLPLASRTARGRPIINLLPLEDDERINAILPVREFEEDKYIVMATADGTVKKTSLKAYSKPRANGIIAVNLKDGDRLIGVDITDGSQQIMIFSDAGKVVRFEEFAKPWLDEDGVQKIDENGEPAMKGGVRPMGRTATGVRGIKLKDEDKVVSLIIPRTDGPILTVTENGYGKRTALADYPTKGRGNQGVVSIKVSQRNGKVVGAVQVDEKDEIMMISNRGTLVRTRVDGVSMVGRNTQGVTLIRTAEDELVVGLQRIDEVEEPEFPLEGEEGEAGENTEAVETTAQDEQPAADAQGDDVADEADED
jgi:DNA gyrase subunit A